MYGCCLTADMALVFLKG